MTASYLFLVFILYSFIGWLWETLLYIVRDRKFVNRGFLFGPLCPIYGCGAMLCSFILYGRISDPGLLFIIGAAVCTLLEYITHWALEKLFHARWWDYSNVRFNLKGRVCLSSAIAFGLCIIVLIDFLHPMVLGFFKLLPGAFYYWASLFIYTFLIADITLTAAGLIGLKERLESLQETITEQMQRGIELTEEKGHALLERFESSQIFHERLQKLTLSSFNSRFVENFPRMKSERYRDALEKVKERLIGK